jgi:hypothetical protein
VAALICLSGCGGNDESAESTAAANGSGETGSSSVEPSGPAAAAGPASTAVAMNDPRTEWINDIPYDAFFDRPLDVVRDQTPVATTTEDVTTPPDAGTESPQTVEDPMPTVEPSGGNRADWGELVSVELLNEGVTDVRNRLTTNLQTLAAYNRSWSDVALDGHTLAALAAAVEAHPDDVSWKENAKYVRDLGYEIYISADATGRDAYEPTQVSFENIVTILNGGPPPDMEADDLTSFAYVVDRNVIMEQIDKTFNWLKADINTETRLEEDADRVAREASVLVAFGTIIQDAEYDFTSEPDYKSFAQDFVNGSREMLAASNSELRDFASFQSGRNTVQTSCGICHQKYQSADSGF